MTLLFLGQVSRLSAAFPKSVKVIETEDGFRVFYPDGRYIDVNETGLLIVDGLQSGKSIESISREISSLTGEPYERVLYDVRNFVGNLKVLGLA